MKEVLPKQPATISPYAHACLNALVKENLANLISIGGGFGLFHYLDYRTTHDVDAWWNETVTVQDKNLISATLEKTLSKFGKVKVRKWGDVVSIELVEENKTIFSFQLASRSVRLENSVSANWINVPLDSLPDLVASKMTALIERGSPRDFLDIFSICQSELVTISECWSLWRKRQALVNSDENTARAKLAIETHLVRIATHRPLHKITNTLEREQAETLRNWFLNAFLKDT
jgi:predicted nucleotidyltransferase component of viral defense system